MSSTASTGQLDSYVFMKQNSDADFNSLQLNQNPGDNNNVEDDGVSNIKQESPIVNESSILNTNEDYNIASNIIHSDVISPKATPISKFESPISTIPTHPDETIQNISSVKKKTPEPAQMPSSSKDLIKGEKLIRIDNQDAKSENLDNSKVSAYARLDFENFIFYVQTLQVLLGRKSEHDQSHSVDVHLGDSKAISRRHAKIFYNFGTERFELSIQGKNGAFVDDTFIETGSTVPLTNKSKIQIGQIVFRFVLPGMNLQENMESPSKPINPSDAISLRSSLYLSAEGSHKSGENTPHLTSQDFKPVGIKRDDIDNDDNDLKSTDISDVPKSINIDSTSSTATPLIRLSTSLSGLDSLNPINHISSSLGVKKPKEKKAPRPPKPPKKVYTIDEIPEEFRTKPACSYSNLIATCLRTHGTPKGMSLAEIYKSIRDIFPYYKYCPDGWQSSVRHNLSLNKAFRKVSKEGKGWLWGLDEEYCAEKERAKKKQQEAAALKAKAAAEKLEQQHKQQQKIQLERLEQQKQLQMAQTAQQQLQQHNLIGINSNLLPVLNKSLQNQGVTQQSNIPLQTGQTFINSSSANIPLQTNTALKQQFPSTLPQQQSLQQKIPDPSQIPKFTPSVPVTNNQIPIFQNSNTSSIPNQPGTNPKIPSIQAQLAANRGIAGNSPASNNIQTKPPNNNLNVNTKKALAHLQQQLVTLSKDLRKLVDKPTISQILTQAIAMTIAQVTQAAKTKGITTDPLATLIDTNPQQLTRILTVALNAATFKVTNGRIKAPLTVGSSSNAGSNNSSAINSRASTPVPTPLSSVTTSTQQQPPSLPNVQPVVSNIQIKSTVNQIPLQRHVSQQSVTPKPTINTEQKPITTPAPVQQIQNSSTSSSASPLAQQTVKKPFIPLIQTNKSSPVEIKTNPTPSPIVIPTGQTLPKQETQGTSSFQQQPQVTLPKPDIVEIKTETLTADTTTKPQDPASVTPLQSSDIKIEGTLDQHEKINVTGTVSDSSYILQNSVSHSTTTDFNFDDLNDPEFDKVLESLSKEPTPGLEDDPNHNNNNQSLDEDELNKLLGSDFNDDDFTKNLNSNNDNGGTNKRNFDDLEGVAVSNEQNKIIKTE